MTNSSQLLKEALGFHRNGLFAEAETIYRKILNTNPRHEDALHLLGVICHQTNRPSEAVKLIGQAVKQSPNNVNFLNNYGLALRANGNTQQAINIYRDALRISPNDLDLIRNIAKAYFECNQFEDSIRYYRKALGIDPNNSDLKEFLCIALQAHGNFCQGNANYESAANCYKEAILLSPGDAALYYNLGNAFRESGNAHAAAVQYEHALKIDPSDPEIHNNLGNVFRSQGKLSEAIDCYKNALSLEPNLYHAKVHLIHQKQHICDWEGLDEQISEIRTWVNEKKPAQISPFAFLAMPGSTPQEQLQCANLWLENRYNSLLVHPKMFIHQKLKKDKLRIGYLSADFRLHPLASLISEVIERHDRDQFDIFAYSYGLDDRSSERLRLENAFDRFNDISKLSIHDSANRIYDDKIDILIDLTGFTQNSRTQIVALKPAPISVNWLGFPGTMGELHNKPLFDYILADHTLVPESSTNFYAEKVAFLPDCYQPSNLVRVMTEHPTKKECGLPESTFVFCCFNQSFKILPDIYTSWLSILKKAPKSVLWLLESNAYAKNNLLKIARMHGISDERIIFAPRLPMEQHLARHCHADLFLDTYPYNAHTTASDALWMGLPVLTFSGETFASRVAGSILNAAGLPELVTNDLVRYQELALKIYESPDFLKVLRQKLADRSKLKLFNTEVFTQNLEKLYFDIWEKYFYCS